MAPDQLNLLPPELLESLERKGNKFPLGLVTFDSTPNYQTMQFVDQAKGAFKRHKIPQQFFIPDGGFSTPRDLILPDHFKAMVNLGDSAQRFLVGVLEIAPNPTVNVVLESPVSSIAWQIFLEKIGVTKKNESNTSINFIKEIFLKRLRPNLEKTISVRTLQLIEPHMASQSNLVLFKERVQIFNESLTRAAKMFSECTDKQVYIATIT